MIKIACLAFALSLASACDNAETPYTWGDMSQDIADSYCDSLLACGLIATDDVDRCSRHTYWHTCEGAQTCDTEIKDSLVDNAILAVAACSVALAEENCDLLYFGVLPQECGAAWEFNPEI